MYNIFETQDFFVEKNYDELLTWTMKARVPCIAKEFLPEKGVYVKLNGKGIGAGFLYKTDSKMAVIGSIVIDNENDADVKKQTFDQIISSLSGLAKKEGFLVATIATNDKEKEMRLQLLDYAKNDTGVSVYMRDLRG